MKYSVAEAIAKKTKGAKHCEKLLKLIEKKGDIEIPLGNTGVMLPISRGDVLHSLIKSVRFKLLHEINAIEVVHSAPRTSMPAPVGASNGIEVACAYCGKIFVKHHARQKFCCEGCRAESYKNRK